MAEAQLTEAELTSAKREAEALRERAQLNKSLVLIKRLF